MITNPSRQKHAANITDKNIHSHKPKALSTDRDRSLLKNTAKLLSEAQKWKARCPFPTPALPLKNIPSPLYIRESDLSPSLSL